MSVTATIRLTSIGSNAGPTFNIYSNIDNYSSIFATATSAQLTAGLQITAPPNTTRLKIESTGICGTIIFTDIIRAPDPTPSITPSPTITPSITPSLTPTPSTSTPPQFPPVTVPPRDPCNYGSTHIIYCSNIDPRSPNYDPRSCQPISTNRANCACLGLFECLFYGGGDDGLSTGTDNDNSNSSQGTGLSGGFILE
jgi:hypothetical protein